MNPTRAEGQRPGGKSRSGRPLGSTQGLGRYQPFADERLGLAGGRRGQAAHNSRRIAHQILIPLRRSLSLASASIASARAYLALPSAARDTRAADQAVVGKGERHQQLGRIALDRHWAPTRQPEPTRLWSDHVPARRLLPRQPGDSGFTLQEQARPKQGKYGRSPLNAARVVQGLS